MAATNLLVLGLLYGRVIKQQRATTRKVDLQFGMYAPVLGDQAFQDDAASVRLMSSRPSEAVSSRSALERIRQI
jgi:hypothetical protein